MSLTDTSDPSDSSVLARTDELFQIHQRSIAVRTDQLFAGLLIFQWCAAIATALWISPFTWSGTVSQIHIHVWVALLLGATVISLPVALAWWQPGRVMTRHSLAIAQMLMGGILIHLTGGRIETHFHVFGSLAFLAFYRDWKVLISASVVVAADHLLRGMFWPQSVFGMPETESWRWVEHAGWVIFEDLFLIRSCLEGVHEMREVAQRQAQLEATQASIEATVEQRTAQLRESQAVLAQAGQMTRLGAWRIEIKNHEDLNANNLHWSDEVYRIFGFEPKGITPTNEMFMSLVHPDDRDRVSSAINQAISDRQPYRVEHRVVRTDGTERVVLEHGEFTFDRSGSATQIVGAVQDITERKRSEAALTQMHHQLMETSRQAGMAEIATNVLHNVGNVLNSVNVSANLLAENMKKSKVSSLSRVVALLNEHQPDLGSFISTDSRGRQVPEYLSQLSSHLLAEQQVMVSELQSLQANIGHIKEIVAMQQNYAKVSGVTEIVDVVDLVEDSLRMNEGALARHGVDVIREYESVPPQNLDKHKILQILVNLIRNAKYACDDAGRSDKQMTLKIATRDGRVQISVTDNGVGIPPENLTRIFSHGFTTRKAGHGFGLHSGALAAREMGGSLTVHSSGLGHGATFTLDLPLSSTEQTHD